MLSQVAKNHHNWRNVQWEMFWHSENPLFALVLMIQMVKNLPAMQETWVRFLGQEDLLEKGMATHSSILAWRTPWGVWWATVHGVTKSWRDWATNTFILASPLTISTRLVGLAAFCSLAVVHTLYIYFALTEQQRTQESWVSKSWRRNMLAIFNIFKICVCFGNGVWMTFYNLGEWMNSIYCQD